MADANSARWWRRCVRITTHRSRKTGENSGDLRSETPASFAQAVFEATLDSGYVEQAPLFSFGGTEAL